MAEYDLAIATLTRARKSISRARRAVQFEFTARWRREPIRRGTVLYEAFAGNGVLCNPDAIFRGLLKDPEFAHLSHVWVLTSFANNRSVLAEFADHPRVKFVKYRSRQYFRYLATAEYLINNSTFPPEFGKREGQIYLNTWHGTPLKRMGYDVEDGALSSANTIRNFVAADYLLAANAFMAEQMYESAYKLRGIYRGLIVEEGYPRIDRQRVTSAEAEATRALLEQSGLKLGDRKVILYAPTWRGTSFRRPEDDVQDLLDRVALLSSLIDTDKYVVLLKPHEVVYRMSKDRSDIRSLVVPNDMPSNVVLGATDILITDYSSIYFDFLATGRPVFFLTPDIEDYAGYRGLYFTPDEWPGPVVDTVTELAAEIASYDVHGLAPDVAERYESSRQRFCSTEDGHVTERVIDIVFRGRREGYRVRSARTDGKPSILFYLGGMRPNGITSSVLNLLDRIDHGAFDVSALFTQGKTAASLSKQREINPAVRQFPRVGGMNGSKFVQFVRHFDDRRGMPHRHTTNPSLNRLWDDEWVRCFGDTTFDYVVDFSGYSPFWATLLLHSPGSFRSVWLHNDMSADAHREVGGAKTFLRGLTGMFALYSHFDRLVSVSAALAEINSSQLAAHAPKDKFVSAPNTVNENKILADAPVDPHTLLKEDEPVPRWLDALDRSDRATFVTAGRLSPEKNHARMIRAFAKVHQEHPNTQLIIVGGGPLEQALQSLITQLGLYDSVILAGQKMNPYSIMSRCDCFVLSSDYEGQPMVLLEAMVLGIACVTVDFGSARGALPPGCGLVVPSTDDGLAEGMLAYLRGEVPVRAFDVAAYNRHAIGEFYAAIGVSEPSRAVQGLVSS